MPRLVPVYEKVDGEVRKIEMFSIDADHAVKADPERYSFHPPKPAPAKVAAPEPLPVDDPDYGPGANLPAAGEPVGEPLSGEVLPAFPLARGRGRPRKENVAE